MKGIDRSPAAPGTLQEAGPLARLLPEWSVIPIIAGLFVLAFRENAGYLNVDDLNAIISDSPAEIYAQISLQDGRYLLVAALRAFKAFDIDGLLDYAVFAALYAFAFAWFCQAAVAYLTHDAGLRPEIVRAWTVLFGALLLTHGFFSDLIAWKIAYPVMLLMLLPVAACLELLARRPLTPRLCLALTALMLLANMAYQPGTTAVLFLAFAWVLVTALSPGSRQGGALRPYLVHVGMIVAAYVAAGAGYVLLTRVVRVVEGIDSARPFALSPLHLVPNHVYHYVKQVIGVFDPTGYMGDVHAGGPLALVASVLVVALAWLGFKRGRLLPVLAGLGGLGLLLSNPQNLLMENYYPSGRSSFYVGFFLPALLLAAHASAPSPRSTDWMMRLTVVVLAFQVAWFVQVSSERVELQRRDFAFAQRIVNAIDADPSTRNVGNVRLPLALPPGIYDGLRPNVGRTTPSIFLSPWARGALLSHASGQRFDYVGESTCPPSGAGPLEIVVRREGDTVDVCY